MRESKLEPFSGERALASETASPPAHRLRVGTALTVTLLLFAGGILDLLKNSAIAFRYGSGSEADAFFAAFIIPGMYGMFWVSSCLVGMVPLFARQTEQHDAAGPQLIGTVLALSGASTIVLACGGYLIAPLLMRVLVPGFTFEQNLRTVSLFRQLTPLFILVGLTGVASAVLNSRHKFLFPASQKLVVNSIVLVGLLFWYSHAGIEWLARLIVGGTLFYAAALLFWMCWSGSRPQIRWAPDTWQVRSLLAAILMPFAALTIRQSSMLVERTIASFLPAGGISALAYTYQVIAGFSSVIGAGVTTTLLPTITRDNSSRGKLALIHEGFYYLLVVLLPVSFGAYVLSEPFVLILFHHGAFTAASVIQSTQIFRAYAFAIIFVEMAGLFQVPFWADRRYRMIIFHNGLMAIVNVLLDLLLAPLFGVVGLALGFTLTCGVSSVRMLWLLSKVYGPVMTKERVTSALKPLAATTAMAIVVLLLRQPVSVLIMSRSSQFYNEVFRTILLVGVGSATYVAAGMLGRMQPFPALYGGLRAQMRRFSGSIFSPRESQRATDR